MRPVRLADAALDDIETQVPTDRVHDFRQFDLRPAMETLAADSPSAADICVPHGPGWRASLNGRSVGGFHLFVASDEVDPRPGALVIYAIDVWLDEFPA